MTALEFPIGAVISITDGHLVAPIGDVHALLDHMTGEPLMTHQLPRASRESEGSLREQHPELAAVSVPPDTDSWEKVDAFLAPLRARFGATVPVHPLPPGDHTRIDPITELRMLRPDAEIITVVVDEEPNDGEPEE